MNTQGFQVVAELSQSLLNQIFEATWTSGGPAGAPNTLPHSFDITAGTVIGSYTLDGGQVQIPLSGVSFVMAPAINGIDVTLGLQLQLQIHNPPVPSASMISMTADVHALLPLGNPAGTINVGLIVGGLPSSSVTATLTSGDPFDANLGTFFSEYLDVMYNNGTIPNTIPTQTVSQYGITADVSGDIYDDPNDPARKITGTIAADRAHATISLPIHLRLANIMPVGTLPDPIGVLTRVDITAPFSVAPNGFTIDLSNPTVTVQPLTPAPGVEGTNYNLALTNYGFIGAALPFLLSSQIQNNVTTLVTSMGPQTVMHPTVGQLQDAIAFAAYQQLTSRGDINLWTPQTVGPVMINDTAPKALANSLAIGIDAGPGANRDSLTSMLPAGRSFAVGVSASKVLELVQNQIHQPEANGGFGPDFPHTPFMVHNVDGHDARLTRLDPSLTTAIHMDGDVTVINAILGSIDVDASFTEDVGLHWGPGPTGGQVLVPDPGTPSVSEGVLAWILSFLIGFITFGAIGAIIGIVVMAVVTSIANGIGSRVIVNTVGSVTGIGAWPGELPNVGTVPATFENPVTISPDGILISG